MIHHFDTRWATYEPDGSTRHMTESEKADRRAPLPRYWVAEKEVDKKLEGRWDKAWFLGWRRIARSTDERTFITTLLPKTAAGDSVFLLLADADLSQAVHLQAALASFPFDFISRQKLGGTNANFFAVEQLPVPPPHARLTHLGSEWLSSRVDRLNGWIPDPDERARVRADVDAYFFHLYGLSRDDAAYVMDTFPIVERNDIAAHGTYRTKDLALATYDALVPEATNP